MGRMITSPAFNGDRILGAILFENTMDRDIKGIPTPTFLWEKKKIIPLLKVDKGLATEEDGCQIMKPNPGLDALLKRAKAKGVFGTKMRSVCKLANEKGISAVVDQQFEVGKRIVAAGLIPILEPEVDITSPEKAKIEEILKIKLLEVLINSVKMKRSRSSCRCHQLKITTRNLLTIRNVFVLLHCLEDIRRKRIRFLRSK